MMILDSIDYRFDDSGDGIFPIGVRVPNPVDGDIEAVIEREGNATAN